MRIPSHSLCRIGVLVAFWTVFGTHPARAQTAPSAPDVPSADAVVQRISTEGMQHSQAEALAQVLLDSIGPRLTGSPANRAANDWLVRTYTAWGVPVHNERYGTWRSWTRGPSRLELVAPRMRTLEATALAWSPATPLGGVTGTVVALPPARETRDSAGFARWLRTVRGQFVLLSAPQRSCRPDTSWARWALPAEYAAMRAARDSARAEWERRTAVAGGALRARLEAAGVAGILTSRWSGGWGVDKITSATTTTAPAFDVSCEDYSLLARLAAHGQHPRLHAVTEGRQAPTEVPVYNTIAEMKGTAHPEQYVMLSAHLDSWDAGSGATDNGTGTIIMLEAMRLLKLAYPHPKRTILVGHWNGEEQGDGSDAFAEDHPEILRGLQALLNQDEGTGRISKISSIGLLAGPAALTRWMSPLPSSLTSGITLDLGTAKGENTDVDGFVCHETPAFNFESFDWDNDIYTWHTNRDTFDKISFGEIERTATLIALLAYEASEDPQQLSRARQGHIDCSSAPRSWKHP